MTRENTTNYSHPQELNLLNLHKAMNYNGAGQPTIRVDSATSTSVSSFNEPISVPITPVVQIDGLYGLNSRYFETFEDSGGVTDTTPTLMRCQTNTTIGAFAVIRSARTVRYRPGQGALARFTAAYTAGVAGYTQQAGFFNVEQAMMIGYDGVDFGVLLSNGGKVHIELLTMTVGASSGDDLKFTLYDVAFTVQITNDSAEINAAEISEWFQDGATGPVDLWTVEHCDGIVHFVSNSVGPKTGTMSFAAGSTGSTGATSTEREGVVSTITWTAQANFNLDTLDGNGPSRVNIDPTMMNIFQISFQWLGVGVIRYCMEHPDTGQMILFHQTSFANTVTDVHTDNPSLQLGYVAASLGGSGTNIIVTGGSMMGAIEGLIETVRLPTAISVSQAENPVLDPDLLHHGLTLHNRLTFNEKLNTHELILKEISIAVTTAIDKSPLEVLIYYNFDGLPSPSVNTIVNLLGSAAFKNDVTGVMTEGDNYPIYASFATGGSVVNINLEDLRITIAPNQTLTVAIRSVDDINSKNIAIVFLED